MDKKEFRFNSRVKKCIYYLGWIFYLLFLFGTLSAPALTYLCYLRVSRYVFIISLFLSLPGIGFLFFTRNFISKKNATQMLLSYLIISIIFLPMFFRAKINGYEIYSNYDTIELFILVIGLIFWLWIYFSSKSWHNKIQIKFDYGFIICILLILIVSSLEQFDTGIKWDSANYYKFIVRLKEFTFNPNDVTLFKNCGHSCYSYMLLASIGENLLPYHGIGVRIQNIVVFFLCIVLVDKIITILMPDIKKSVRYGSVFLFTVTPVILGTIQDISPEIYVLFFFLCFYFCYLKKYYIIGLLFSIFLVFAKETGIIILAGFYLGWIIQFIISCLKYNGKIRLLTKDTILTALIVYIPAILFVIYFSVDSAWGTVTTNQEVVASSLAKGNVFGIDVIVILTKLKQMFLMNYAWITTIIGIYGMIKYTLAKKRIHLNLFAVLPLVISYFAFLAVQLLYITYTFPRYLMLQYFFACLLFAAILNSFIQRKSIRTIILSGSVMLTFAQNYYGIDLITKKIFTSLDIGRGTMAVNSPLYIDENGMVIEGEEASKLYLSPYAQYNKQWSYFDKLMDKVMQTIAYSKDDLVLLPDMFFPYSNGIYWGYWTDNFYDSENGRIMQIFDFSEQDFTHLIPIEYALVTEATELENINKYKRVFYISFSFSEEMDYKFLEKYKYKLISEQTFRGWDAKIYSINQYEG